MSAVAKAASIIAAAAETLGTSGVHISIYREDPNDLKPINVDTFEVWEDLPSRPDFKAIVEAASTDFDDNMKSYLEETVFIVPQSPGTSHWLDREELPYVVKMILPGPGSSAPA